MYNISRTVLSFLFILVTVLLYLLLKAASLPTVQVCDATMINHGFHSRANNFSSFFAMPCLQKIPVIFLHSLRLLQAA